jgi:hypothetical protein
MLSNFKHSIVPDVPTPLWVKWENETPTPKVGDLESLGLPNVQSSIVGAKTPFIGVFLVSLQSS